MPPEMQAPTEAPPEYGSDMGSESDIHIPSANLPKGIKEGDMLRCTGMDSSGCTFALESAEGEEQGEGDGSSDNPPDKSWESDFRDSMSPRNPDETAQ